MSNVIIIGGGGASGKSEIIKYLSSHSKNFLGYKEIGQSVFHRWKIMYELKGMAFSSTTAPKEYDMEIIKKEIKQCREILSNKLLDKVRAIECGIIGDLAYILNRNPDLYEKFIKDPKVLDCLDRLKPKGVLLKVKRSTMRKRIKLSHQNYIPSGMTIEKFIDVQVRLFDLNYKVYSDLGIESDCNVIDNDDDIAKTASIINKIVCGSRLHLF